jgi:hypothetical protein
MESYEHASDEIGNGGILVLEPLSEGVAPAFTHTTGLSGLEATCSSTLQAIQSLPPFFELNDLTPVMRLVVPWVCSWAIKSSERAPSRSKELSVQMYILISPGTPSEPVPKLASTALAVVHSTIDIRC